MFGLIDMASIATIFASVALVLHNIRLEMKAKPLHN